MYRNIYTFSSTFPLSLASSLLHLSSYPFPPIPTVLHGFLLITSSLLTLFPNNNSSLFALKKKKNMSSSLKPYIEVLIEGSRHLTSEETEKAFSCILSGSDDVQVGSLLTLLRARNETPEEIAGMVRAMNSACNAVHLPGMKLLDIVGTGGDGADTINISTASVVLAAACGCTVAKVCFRCFVLVFYLTT